MPVAERPVTGLECKIYYNAATHASPTWVEITRAINVSYTISKGEATQDSRTTTWRKTKGTIKELEITFTYRKKQGTDTVFDALIAASVADTILEWAVLDGAHNVSGVQGIRCFGELFSAGNTQDLESVEEVEFTVKPAYKEESSVEINPDWYKVT